MKIPYMTIAKILGPIVLIGVLLIGHKMAISGAYKDGVKSRDAEVTTLTGERDTALADIETLTGDLQRCRSAKLAAETESANLNRKLVAQADENATALRKQAEQFASTQAVTTRAMDTLARNTKANDIDFAAILEQLKGVEYDYNQDTGRCIIRSGGRILRDAARGKSRD